MIRENVRKEERIRGNKRRKKKRESERKERRVVFII